MVDRNDNRLMFHQEDEEVVTEQYQPKNPLGATARALDSTGEPRKVELCCVSLGLLGAMKIEMHRSQYHRHGVERCSLFSTLELIGIHAHPCRSLDQVPLSLSYDLPCGVRAKNLCCAQAEGRSIRLHFI